jgi:hypothetical protein
MATRATRTVVCARRGVADRGNPEWTDESRVADPAIARPRGPARFNRRHCCYGIGGRVTGLKIDVDEGIRVSVPSPIETSR